MKLKMRGCFFPYWLVSEYCWEILPHAFYYSRRCWCRSFLTHLSPFPWHSRNFLPGASVIYIKELLLQCIRLYKRVIVNQWFFFFSVNNLTHGLCQGGWVCAFRLWNAEHRHSKGERFPERNKSILKIQKCHLPPPIWANTKFLHIV